MLRELHAAWRRLARRPGYAALSIAVLGVGLGVVVFLFSLINTLILTPLPLPHADRLMAVGELNRGNGGADTGIGIGDIDTEQYLRLAAALRGVDATGGYLGVGASLDTGAGATRLDGVRLTASMLDLLGVRPLLGRGLLVTDDQPGAPPVVLLGEDLWRHAYGADPPSSAAPCASTATGPPWSAWCRPVSPSSVTIPNCGCRYAWTRRTARTSTWSRG